MDNGESSYRRFLDGDENAFGEIIDLYADNLIFFINRYVHNLSTAEDLSEDVFVEVLLHKHRYRFNNSLKTYLFAIGRHKALDYIRKSARRGEILSDEPLEQTKSDESFEDKFLIGERNKELLDAIDGLNDDYKTVLHLVYFEEMSADEAGHIMKKNRKQIENLLYRAKGAIKTVLEKEGFSYEKQR